MSQTHVLEKLLLYLDGDLPPGEMQQIREHLSGCAECSRQLTLLAPVWQSEQRKERLTPSPFLWTRIQARIEEDEKTPAFGWDVLAALKQLFTRPVTAFGLIAAIAAGIYLGTPGSMQTTQNSQAVVASAVVDEFGLDQFDLVPPGTVGGGLANFSRGVR